MEAVIEFDSVSKRFGSKQALDQVSFQVPPGVVFALLGDNGAGKTTTIKTLLGIVSPDAGRASVFGLSCQKDDLAIRRRVGFVPEQPQLYEWMRVDEMGWFASGFYGEAFKQEYQKRIDEFEVPAKKKIETLSKGMKAKVSLALALSHHPELLILDEPTSGLDPMIRREFLESMVERAAEGQTVFLSSHQITEVERVADYVALMRQGKLLLVERLDELKTSTTELSITVAEQGVPLPEFDGTIVHSRKIGRQWRVIARDINDEQLDVIRGREFVDGCQCRTPSLEEIFVGYMQDESELSARNGWRDSLKFPSSVSTQGEHHE